MHPENRKERGLVGEKKGFKRGEALVGTWSKTREERQQSVERLAKHQRDTTKLCSCHMCGNPRKFYGEKTRHEYESDNDFEQQLKEEEKRRNDGM